jgi:hypothetical protein
VSRSEMPYIRAMISQRPIQRLVLSGDRAPCTHLLTSEESRELVKKGLAKGIFVETPVSFGTLLFTLFKGPISEGSLDFFEVKRSRQGGESVVFTGNNDRFQELVGLDEDEFATRLGDHVVKTHLADSFVIPDVDALENSILEGVEVSISDPVAVEAAIKVCINNALGKIGAIGLISDPSKREALLKLLSLCGNFKLFDLFYESRVCIDVINVLNRLVPEGQLPPKGYHELQQVVKNAIDQSVAGAIVKRSEGVYKPTLLTKELREAILDLDKELRTKHYKSAFTYEKMKEELADKKYGSYAGKFDIDEVRKIMSAHCTSLGNILTLDIASLLTKGEKLTLRNFSDIQGVPLNTVYKINKIHKGYLAEVKNKSTASSAA